MQDKGLMPKEVRKITFEAGVGDVLRLSIDACATEEMLTDELFEAMSQGLITIFPGNAE